MRTRIADDPDSWGKPADLERKPITADDSKCPSCGVQWMHHMADLCPITPSRPMTGFFAGLTDEQKAAALAYRGPENIGPAMYPADGGLSEPKMAFEDTTSLRAIVRRHFLGDSGSRT